MNLEDQIAQIREDGFCILEGVIPGEDVDRVRQSVEATVEEHCSKSPPENVGFVPSLIVHDQSFATYLADERLLGIAEAMLGKHIRISFTSAIINLTGNKRGDWHADWPFNQRNAGHFPEPYPNIVAHLTSLWMLSPFTSENGGTLIFPGSHLLNCNPTGTHEHPPAAPLPDEIHVTGSAGSVVVMDSRLWHAASPNRTDRPRTALAVRFAPWWLNVNVLMPGSEDRKRIEDESGKIENIVPAVPKNVFDGLPEKVKPLYLHWVREAGEG